MQPAPAVLTPERIDALLSRSAEVCAAALDKAGERLQTAEDMADFERAGRTLNTVCRNLRQTIAMKQRFDREQAALAADRRRDAEAERQDAERTHRDAVTRHHVRVRRHFGRVLWNEHEDDDAQEIFNDLDERLSELADDGAFLETPVETLIQRLAEEFCPPPSENEPDGDEPGGEDPEAVADEPVEPLAAPVAALPPPEPEPPPRPPDPPPEPYLMPWERTPHARRHHPGLPGGWQAS